MKIITNNTTFEDKQLIRPKEDFLVIPDFNKYLQADPQGNTLNFSKIDVYLTNYFKGTLCLFMPKL